jgi:hypothetical protein
MCGAHQPVEQLLDLSMAASERIPAGTYLFVKAGSPLFSQHDS